MANEIQDPTYGAVQTAGQGNSPYGTINRGRYGLNNPFRRFGVLGSQGPIFGIPVQMAKMALPAAIFGKVMKMKNQKSY